MTPDQQKHLEQKIGKRPEYSVMTTKDSSWLQYRKEVKWLEKACVYLLTESDKLYADTRTSKLKKMQKELEAARAAKEKITGLFKQIMTAEKENSGTYITNEMIKEFEAIDKGASDE